MLSKWLAGTSQERHGVPVWALLGGRYRDKMRLYADTPGGSDEADQRARLKDRLEVQGFTWLKMDQTVQGLAARGETDLLVNNKFWGFGVPRQAPAAGGGQKPSGVPQASIEQYMSYSNTEHPFTQIQLTDKGIQVMADQVGRVRKWLHRNTSVLRSLRLYG